MVNTHPGEGCGYPHCYGVRRISFDSVGSAGPPLPLPRGGTLNAAVERAVSRAARRHARIIEVVALLGALALLSPSAWAATVPTCEAEDGIFLGNDYTMSSTGTWGNIFRLTPDTDPVCNDTGKGYFWTQHMSLDLATREQVEIGWARVRVKEWGICCTYKEWVFAEYTLGAYTHIVKLGDLDGDTHPYPAFKLENVTDVTYNDWRLYADLDGGTNFQLMIEFHAMAAGSGSPEAEVSAYHATGSQAAIDPAMTQFGLRARVGSGGYANWDPPRVEQPGFTTFLECVDALDAYEPRFALPRQVSSVKRVPNAGNCTDTGNLTQPG